MRLKKYIFFILVVFSFLPPLNSYGAHTWTNIQDGLDYLVTSKKNQYDNYSTIHVLKIDLTKFSLKVLRAKDEKIGNTVEILAKQAKAIAAINGGFFSEDHRSIGLLIQDGKTLNSLHKTSWWSIFSIKNNQPSIVTPGNFSPDKKIEMAIQVGPRLLIDGKIPNLKMSMAARSAIGITADGKVIIVGTNGAGISLQKLATFLKTICVSAMALDGGTSSQMWVESKKFKLSTGTPSLITNAIGVFGK
ncbi:MAG: phosphodiester glycosidase family protein [Pseudomonadota bacterium]